MTRILLCDNCYVVKEENVLMLHRNPNSSRFPDYWMVPGGRQEPYEGVIQLCANHVEEWGVEIKDVKLRVIATQNYPHIDELYLVFNFIADYAGGELKPYSRGEILWININDLLCLDKLYPDLLYHIPLVFDEKDELYYTFMEFDEDSEIVRRIIRTPMRTLEEVGFDA